MNAEPRTVTVTVLTTQALDIDEPTWCVDAHSGAQFKPDIVHNGPEIAAYIETGDTALAYLQAWITTAPYGVIHHEPLPLVAIDVAGTVASYDPDTVRAFTRITRLHLDRIDQLADEAERLRGGGQ
ncbi:hypothetical protein OG302_22395 [Streptomyces sp. NBC_01283]|uniref:DUF6907 domain-containing protein n=1 Tax=Streptomyces sp. NBC_01283 TaxID=2903812 RepID=UPI00352D84FE|nr:hypothetical protein OG302_22395 [Streptomyces sp. NBC_01283]